MKRPDYPNDADGEDLSAWLRMMAGEFARKQARRLAAEPQFERLETVRDVTPAPPDGYLTTIRSRSLPSLPLTVGHSHRGDARRAAACRCWAAR